MEQKDNQNVAKKILLHFLKERRLLGPMFLSCYSNIDSKIVSSNNLQIVISALERAMENPTICNLNYVIGLMVYNMDKNSNQLFSHLTKKRDYPYLIYMEWRDFLNKNYKTLKKKFSLKTNGENYTEWIQML